MGQRARAISGPGRRSLRRFRRPRHPRRPLRDPGRIMDSSNTAGLETLYRDGLRLQEFFRQVEAEV